MTEYLAGGRRRLDRVLDPAVLEHMTFLSAEELTAKFDEAQAEETTLSYVRRLLQGRLDILCAERNSRACGEAAPGHTDEEIAARLCRLLADTPARTSPATGPIEIVPPPLGLRRRAAERAIDDVELSNSAALDDAQLDSAIDRLRALESGVSRSRRGVHHVLDTLTAELDRRVAAGVMVTDRPLP